MKRNTAVTVEVQGVRVRAELCEDGKQYLVSDRGHIKLKQLNRRSKVTTGRMLYKPDSTTHKVEVRKYCSVVLVSDINEGANRGA